MSLSVVALTATIGGDARWAGALGRVIVREGSVPAGVPYATAKSSSWPNVTVLAQLLAAGAGTRALLLAQLTAVSLGFWITACSARKLGASDKATGAVLAALGCGGALALLIIRLQLVSVPLFAALVALLRRQHRRPSASIWWIVPLLAVWANLHGAVLLGFTVACLYLIATAAAHRRVQPVLVLASAAVALVLTPAFLRTPEYYLGVLEGVSAVQRIGFWAPPNLRSPFDLALILMIIMLVVGFIRERPAVWEWLCLSFLTLATARTARSGIWLLLFLASTAASGFTREKRQGPRARRGIQIPLVLTATAFLLHGLVRGPILSGASDSLVLAAVQAAHGSPIAANGALGEQVAAAGGCIWIGNPLDAFSSVDQTKFLDWESGGSSSVLPAESEVALVISGGPADRSLARDPSWRRVRADRHATLRMRVDRSAASVNAGLKNSCQSPRTAR